MPLEGTKMPPRPWMFGSRSRSCSAFSHSRSMPLAAVRSHSACMRCISRALVASRGGFLFQQQHAAGGVGALQLHGGGHAENAAADNDEVVHRITCA